MKNIFTGPIQSSKFRLIGKIKGLALKSKKIQRFLEGKEPKKIIYVKGKIISIVV